MFLKADLLRLKGRAATQDSSQRRGKVLDGVWQPIVYPLIVQSLDMDSKMGMESQSNMTELSCTPPIISLSTIPQCIIAAAAILQRLEVLNKAFNLIHVTQNVSER